MIISLQIRSIFYVSRYTKNQALPNSYFCLESAEFTNKKHGKPTLHSLIANHVSEMSLKLKFQFNVFFCSDGLELVSYLFLLRRLHPITYHSFLLLP